MNEQVLIETTQALLEAIASMDLKTYKELCDESLTCFEPEARGHLVEGLAFHEYYFELESLKSTGPINTTMVRPHVRILSDTAAVVSYIRLTQATDANGMPSTTTSCEETRVWQLIDGKLKNVHFHRSKN